MAKQNITQGSWATNTIQSFANQVVGQASNLKAAFDKAATDILTYVNNTLIAELNGNTGANKIGMTNPNLAADNVGDGIEEVRAIAVQAQAGTIADNSLGNIKLAVDIKVGSLGSLTTTEKGSVTGAINEIDSEVGSLFTSVGANTTEIATNKTLLDIIRTAKTSTGSAVAYSLDTDGTFDLTRTGNRVMFIPNVANSGACTIAVDGQTAKPIRKAEGTGYVALVANDIKQGAPTELVWSVANDFFILRPSGGASVKTIQSGTTTITTAETTKDITITGVDTSKSIVLISQSYTTAGTQGNVEKISIQLLNGTTIRAARGASGVNVDFTWQVVEFESVKSLQRGVATTPVNVTITSVNTLKSLVFVSTRTASTSNDASYMFSQNTLTNATTLNLSSGRSVICEWQVIEFN